MDKKMISPVERDCVLVGLREAWMEKFRFQILNGQCPSHDDTIKFILELLQKTGHLK